MFNKIGKVFNANGARVSELRDPSHEYVTDVIVDYINKDEKVIINFNEKFNIDKVKIELKYSDGHTSPCTEFVYYPAGPIRTIGESFITFKVVDNDRVFKRQLPIQVKKLIEIPQPTLSADFFDEKLNLPYFIFNGATQKINISKDLDNYYVYTKELSPGDTNQQKMETGEYVVTFGLKHPETSCWKKPEGYIGEFDYFGEITRKWQIKKKKAVMEVAPLGSSNYYKNNFNYMIRPGEKVKIRIKYDGSDESLQGISSNLKLEYSTLEPFGNKRIPLQYISTDSNYLEFNCDIQDDNSEEYPINKTAIVTITIKSETETNLSRYDYNDTKININFKFCKTWTWDDDQPINEEWLDGLSKVIDPLYNQQAAKHNFLGKRKKLQFNRPFMSNESIEVECIQETGNSSFNQYGPARTNERNEIYFQTYKTFIDPLKPSYDNFYGDINKQTEYDKAFQLNFGDELYGKNLSEDQQYIPKEIKKYLGEIQYKYVPSGSDEKNIKRTEIKTGQYIIIPSVNNLGGLTIYTKNSPTNLDVRNEFDINSEIFNDYIRENGIGKSSSSLSISGNVYYWTRTPFEFTLVNQDKYKDMFAVVDPQGNYKNVKVIKTLDSGGTGAVKDVSYKIYDYVESDQSIRESETKVDAIYYAPIFRIQSKSELYNNDRTWEEKKNANN